MQIHEYESLLLQNNTQLYVHVHQYIQFKDSEQVGYLKQIYNK